MKPAVDFIRHFFQYLAQPDQVEAFQKFLGRPEKSLHWEELFQLLHLQGLAPFTYYSLRAPEWQSRLPEPFLAQLKNTFRETSLQNFFLQRELKRLNKHFFEARLMAIPLKGASLINRFYPLPGLRPMQDIDLLIPNRDWEQVKRVLLMAGYQPLSDLPEKWVKGFHFHAAFILPGRNVVVEVHWNLTDEHLLPLDKWKALWDRAYFSESARSWFLADRDQFLYQCLHLYKHGTFNAVLARQPDRRELLFDALSGNRLIWFLDLWLLMKEEPLPDLEGLIREAQHWQVGAALHSGLVLTQALFQPLPQWTWPPGQLPPAIPRVKYFLLARLADGAAKETRWTRTLLKRLQSLDQRLHVRPVRALDLMDRLFPSPDQRREWLERHSRGWVPFLYLFVFLRGFGLTFSQSLTLIKMKRCRGLKKP
jgi:hypothetical protein